ncbi:MAG TPA: hypothetical protein VN761_04095 [Candidatus Polarisedimenticolia bacterium]|nr:hypothetical protein [Candidatus Polarisedimenticolia bacterium]
MNRFFSICKWIAALMLAPAFGGVLAGCAPIGTPRDIVRVSTYHPQNVFVNVPSLPVNIRRVVVLPLTCDESSYDAVEGRALLEPVLRAELVKTKKFEVVSANTDFLKNRMGKDDWGSEETLPPEFFDLLRENSGCDAVLFARLTVYRPYPPLVIGWRLRLVEAQTRKTIWAADEVFDAGQPAVENGARRHQLLQDRDAGGAPDIWFVQNSPSKFGEYAAARLFATLPER